MKDYTKVYATIFWLSLLSILIWTILKTLGYINTPKIVELFPLYSAIFGAGAFFQMARDIKARLGRIENKVEYEYRTLRQDIHRLDKRLSILEIDD